MKAVCVLLCLGLARHIAGSIFSRQYSLPERYGQPLDYIEQVPYQYQQAQYQQAEDQQEQFRQAETKQAWYQQPEARQAQYQQPEARQAHQQTEANEDQYQQAEVQQNQHEQVETMREQYQQAEAKQAQDQQAQAKQGHYQPTGYQQAPRQQTQFYRAQPKQDQYQNRGSRQVIKHISIQVAETPNAVVMPNEDQSQEQVFDYLNPMLNGQLYDAPRYADLHVTPFINKRVSNYAKKAYGDAINWRGIQLAAGPNSQVQKKEQISKIFSDAQQATKHVSEETKKKFHEDFEAIPVELAEDANLNATQLLKKYEYPVEEHTVKTDDGYFLTMFRIQKPISKPVSPRPVVLLMHGLLGSADDWLLLGPGQSLAYLLADQGYDVWLGNVRGNKYSRRHASKHPGQPDFWMYSNDEIALHDLPAMINYALKTSGQPKLHYVGYSQGTTSFFALAAARPEYNNKVAMMYALSPMAYMTNVRSPLVRMIAPNSVFYDNLYHSLGNGEFKPSKELLYTMGGEMCETEIGCKNVCSNVNFVMSGVNVENMDATQMRIVMGHLPAGASTRQIKQYGQAVASHEFRMYDYGVDINEKVYGDRIPPVYDVTRIQTPVSLYYSEADWLAHPDDVSTLRTKLPNVTDSYAIPVDHFSHMDFMYSKKAPEVVYKRLIDSIDNYATKN